MMFFTQFKRRYDYEDFECFKNKMNYYKRLKKEISLGCISKHTKCLDNITKYIEKRKEDLKSLFDFSVFEKYKEKYHTYATYETAYEKFKNTKSFKSYEVSKQTEEKIFDIINLLSICKSYSCIIANDEHNIDKIKFEIEEFERDYSKQIEDISLNDYRHILLKNVYFVLGNHEYIEFSNVQTCADYYKEKLSKLGITLLENGYVKKDGFLLYGGTGFAKYDEVWNADRVVCCPNFTRKEEMEETTAFENGYKEALEFAKKEGLCFLCVSHYPISACLNNVFDRETIYFAGHNHCNEYVKTTDKVLYADNQIGYENNHIVFKVATTGFIINPYGALDDGLYNTTVEEYLQFYRYLGENIGEGKLLYNRCENGRAYLLVVKRRGYYGFFVITPKGSSKGISIVNGGKTKKLTDSTEIAWICENFEIVVSKYLQMLLPLRKAQEELSKELKELGLDGTMHGIIVDIDFYHHIAVNPVEGSLEFYYSSFWGRKMGLNSFSEVIKSLELNKESYDRRDYKLIQEKYDENTKKKGYLLGIPSGNYLLEDDFFEREEHIVSRKEGMYGVSRKINPLQRLFSGHVLRDFDLRLTETEQQPYRKHLYINRTFIYEGIRYQIVSDNGSDIIIAEEIQKGSSLKGNAIKLTGNTRKFAIRELKRMGVLD